MQFVTGIDPDTIADVVDLSDFEASFDELGIGEFALDSAASKPTT